jgi:hypothetical protein
LFSSSNLITPSHKNTALWGSITTYYIIFSAGQLRINYSSAITDDCGQNHGNTGEYPKPVNLHQSIASVNFMLFGFPHFVVSVYKAGESFSTLDEEIQSD